MTDQELKGYARGICLHLQLDADDEPSERDIELVLLTLRKVAAAAATEEREACARLADLEVRDAVNADIRFVAKALAEGIRARRGE